MLLLSISNRLEDTKPTEDNSFGQASNSETKRLPKLAQMDTRTFLAGFVPNYCIPGHVTEPATEP